MAMKKGMKAQLQKDPGGHQVPGFLGRTSAPKAQARSYASWNRKTGPDNRSTKIPLPSGK